MKECTKCKMVLGDRAKFCPQHGDALQTVQTLQCRDAVCKQFLADHWNWCPYCGLKINK